jgi:beta-lactamase class A
MRFPRLDPHRAGGFPEQCAMGGSARHTIRFFRSPVPPTAISLLLIGILLSGCSQSSGPVESAAIIGSSPAPSPTPYFQVTPMITPAPPITPTATAIPKIPQTDEQETASALLNDEPGVYGYAVLDQEGNVIAAYNSQTPFITASTYKLVLMADIYRRIEAGELSLDQTAYLDPALFDSSGGDMYWTWDSAGAEVPISELLYAVGAWSSNVSALTLLGYTDADALRETAASIGMDRTYLFANPYDLPYWPPEPGIDSSQEDMDIAIQYLEQSYDEEGWVNITTPLDMATYQLGLINDTVISPWVSEQIMDILFNNAIRDRLPAYNWDIPVADKPGNLPGVVNDTGVLFLPDGPRAVAAYSLAVPDDLHATDVIGLLGLIASGNTDIW